MTRLTTPKTPPTTPVALGNIAELDRTHEGAKHTRHVHIRGFGVSPEKALFVRLGFSYLGKQRTRLLPLANLTPTSGEFDRLNVDGARLISPQARRELIDRIQATLEEGPRFQVATRLGWHRHAFVLPDRVIDASGKKVWVHLDDGGRRERFERYRTGGALDGWQEIARLGACCSITGHNADSRHIASADSSYAPHIAQICSDP